MSNKIKTATSDPVQFLELIFQINLDSSAAILGSVLSRNNTFTVSNGVWGNENELAGFRQNLENLTPQNLFYFSNSSKLEEILKIVNDTFVPLKLDFSSLNSKMVNLEEIGFSISSSSPLIPINFKALENYSFPNLTILNLVDVDSEMPDLSKFKKLKNLTFVNRNAGSSLQLSGVFDIGQLTELERLSFIDLSLAQQDLDYYMQRLYEAGASFTGSGKRIDIRNALVLPSGNIGDPLSAGTGQAYITGLIDNFNWTVSQNAL